MYSDALSSCIEISIGLAGFSGIVAAIQSSRGSITDQQIVAFQTLLGASAFTALFALFPLYLLFESPSRWGVFSAVYALLFVGFGVYRAAQLVMGTVPKALGWIIVVNSTWVAAIHLFNTLFWNSGEVYISMLILHLAFAFSAFVTLMRSVTSKNETAVS